MTMSEYEVIERVCERAMQQPSTVTKNQTRSGIVDHSPRNFLNRKRRKMTT